MTKNIFSLRSFVPEILALILAVTTLTASAFPVFASSIKKEETTIATRAITLEAHAKQNEQLPFGALPKAAWGAPSWKIHIPITAYSSEPEQTDDTPFITASGAHVRDGIVAANFLPIGTKVRIPELYGDKEFVVEDRMNARYTHRMDIWMNETREARKFGLKHATIEVFPRAD